MKKSPFKAISNVLSQLAILSLALTHAGPAIADVSSFYAPPPPPGMISPDPSYYNNPAIILQNQADLNIYGATGNNLGQLTPGTTFQTQVLQDPFHDVMNAPEFNFNDVFGTTTIAPTPMGYMVPATLDETAMLTNGMTLPPDTNFFIPPAEYNYQQMQIIGARSDYENADITKLIDNILSYSPDSYSDDSATRDDRDDDDYHEHYRSRRHHNDSSSHDNYLKDFKPLMVADLVRPSSDSGTANLAGTRAQAPSRQSTNSRVVPSTGPFSVLGPTCDCQAHGRSCVITGAFHSFRQAGRGLKAHFHAGIDIGGSTGTPIIAAADGYVTEVRDTGNRGYGKKVDIKHADNYMTRYADMSEIKVRPGQQVKRGDVIGYMGATGNSTGPHVHFETCKLQNPNGKCNSSNVINPLEFMSSSGSINQYKQFNMTCTDAQSSTPNASSQNASQSTTGRRRATR